MAKILIIEDDADIAAIEQDYLALAGHDVVIKADGSAGLQAALTGDFDLLLLDLMLPGVDGFTICKQVREQKKLPILMVSARTGDADKIRGLGFGADDYIEKPFSPSVLVARVKAHLAQVERLRPSEEPESQITVGPLTAKPARGRCSKTARRSRSKTGNMSCCSSSCAIRGRSSAARTCTSSSGGWNPWEIISQSRFTLAGFVIK